MSKACPRFPAFCFKESFPPPGLVRERAQRGYRADYLEPFMLFTLTPHPLPGLLSLVTTAFLITSPSHKPWVELLSVAEAGAGLVWQN